MYKVKNLTKEPRQFWDTFTGSNVVVGVGQTVLTSKPPENGEVWEVKLQGTANREKPVTKNNRQKFNEENIENGSSN